MVYTVIEAKFTYRYKHIHTHARILTSILELLDANNYAHSNRAVPFPPRNNKCTSIKNYQHGKSYSGEDFTKLRQVISSRSQEFSQLDMAMRTSRIQDFFSFFFSFCFCQGSFKNTVLISSRSVRTGTPRENPSDLP